MPDNHHLDIAERIAYQWQRGGEYVEALPWLLVAAQEGDPRMVAATSVRRTNS